MKIPKLDDSARLLLQSAALSAAANSILITDRAGTILWVNPAFSDLTGFSASEAVGQNPRLLKSGRHDTEFYESFWKTLGTGQTWRGEFINRRKDSSLCVIEQTVAPVRTNGSSSVTHFVGIMQDITARKAAENEVRLLNEQLETRVGERTDQLLAANKELEAFAYSVSHDLRAPLRHIRGFVELLADSVKPVLTNDTRHFLAQIQSSAAEMTALIDDLLEFSRTARTSLQQEKVELRQLVDSAIRRLEPETRERNIVWKIGPLSQVWADPSLLGYALVNLLSNAIKYSGSRNPAQIEVGCIGDPPGQVVVFVKDNGVGFDMNYVDRLFGVFQRLHSREEFDGTGIGLANAKRIISRHGGRIWAEAKEGEGATFYFSIPRHASEVS
jgi:PAS domain S-box-containing protein